MNKEYLLKVLKEDKKRLLKERKRLVGLVLSPIISHPEVYQPELDKVNSELVMCEESIKELEGTEHES